MPLGSHRSAFRSSTFRVTGGNLLAAGGGPPLRCWTRQQAFARGVRGRDRTQPKSPPCFRRSSRRASPRRTAFFSGRRPVPVGDGGVLASHRGRGAVRHEQGQRYHRRARRTPRGGAECSGRTPSWQLRFVWRGVSLCSSPSWRRSRFWVNYEKKEKKESPFSILLYRERRARAIKKKVTEREPLSLYPAGRRSERGDYEKKEKEKDSRSQCLSGAAALYKGRLAREPTSCGHRRIANSGPQALLIRLRRFQPWQEIGGATSYIRQISAPAGLSRLSRPQTARIFPRRPFRTTLRCCCCC